jgi:hypothetical protein
MNLPRFGQIRGSKVNRRMSRRAALRTGAAGLVAFALVTAGVGR